MEKKYGKEYKYAKDYNLYMYTVYLLLDRFYIES